MRDREYSLKDITPEKVSAAVVNVDFFGTMMRKLANQHGDGHGPGDPHLAAFFSYVETEGIEPGQEEATPDLRLEDHLRISSAVHRFYALGELEKAGHLKHWVKEKGDHLMLHPALIHAACNAQLLVRGEQLFFQPIEFLNLALNAADVNRPF